MFSIDVKNKTNVILLVLPVAKQAEIGQSTKKLIKIIALALISQKVLVFTSARFLIFFSRWQLVRVSEDFRVIALGLPVPQYIGNPLDPPLRSRFQVCGICTLAHSPDFMLGIFLAFN